MAILNGPPDSGKHMTRSSLLSLVIASVVSSAAVSAEDPLRVKSPDDRIEVTFLLNDQGQPVPGASISLLLPDALVDVTPAFTNYLNASTGGTSGGNGVLTLSGVQVAT